MEFKIQITPIVYGSRAIGTDILQIALSKNLIRKSDISNNVVSESWRPFTNSIILSFKAAKKTRLFQNQTVFDFEVLVKIANFNRLFQLGYLDVKAHIYNDSNYIDGAYVKRERIELQIFLTDKVWALLKQNDYSEEKAAEVLANL